MKGFIEVPVKDHVALVSISTIKFVRQSATNFHSRVIYLLGETPNTVVTHLSYEEIRALIDEAG